MTKADPFAWNPGFISSFPRWLLLALVKRTVLGNFTEGNKGNEETKEASVECGIPRGNGRAARIQFALGIFVLFVSFCRDF
jgi:hypothetical protein